MARPGGGMTQITGGAPGKQTIVIASPRASVPGATPTKIITAMPRAQTAGIGGAGGTQYIVVTTRPGGTAGTVQQAINVSSAAAAGRVISKSVDYKILKQKPKNY